MHIKLGVVAGETLDRVVDTAIYISGILGIIVYFDFNGIEVYACSEVDEPATVISRWQTQIKRGEGQIMGKNERGKRDGTGPHKDSYVKQQGQDQGRRQQQGETCPADKQGQGQKQQGEGK